MRFKAEEFKTDKVGQFRPQPASFSPHGANKYEQNLIPNLLAFNGFMMAGVARFGMFGAD